MMNMAELVLIGIRAVRHRKKKIRFILKMIINSVLQLL